jgi:hypothetical protein
MVMVAIQQSVARLVRFADHMHGRELKHSSYTLHNVMLIAHTTSFGTKAEIVQNVEMTRVVAKRLR